MEKDFRDIGFEGFLREQTDGHKVTPSEQVWLSIHQKMHPNRRWPNLVAALALFGLGLMTGILLDEDRSSNIIQENNPNSSASSLDGSGPVRHSTPLRKALKQGGPKTAALFGAQKPQTSESHPETLAVAAGRTGSMTVEAPSHRIEDTDHRTYFQSTVVPINTQRLAARTGQPPIGSLGLASIPLDKKQGLVVSGMYGEAAGKTPGTESPSSGRPRRSAIQLYFSPSISYRRLVGQATQTNIVYNGLPYSANLGFPTDVNKAVTHKPSVGMELGASLAYPLTANLRFKAGLQFNLNNYEIEAYNYTPEMASLTAAASPGYSRPINTVSYYRNFFGFSRTWLRNSHFMVSTPIGLELSVPAGRRVSVNMASTLQPTYTLRNNSYLISTNLKNYAQEPSLYRDWNVHAGAEAYVSVSKGSYRWIVGPQIRYQILSSYKENYPIREHLIDYGMKFGIQKTLR
jgi:hypothetical protein